MPKSHFDLTLYYSANTDFSLQGKKRNNVSQFSDFLNMKLAIHICEQRHVDFFVSYLLRDVL